MVKIGLKEILQSHGGIALKLIKIIDFSFGCALAFILPAQKQNIPPPIPIKNILIVRPGGIGDAVFMLPIIKQLKSQGVAVDILCETRNAQIFSSQGNMVYEYNKLSQMYNAMQNPYDMVIDSEQWHYLSAVISSFMKTKYRIGFATRPARAKLFNKHISYDNDAYESDNFLKLFEGLIDPQHSIRDVNKCFDISQEDWSWAQGKVPDQGVTVFLGASIALRRFSKEQLRVILQDLLSLGKVPVLLGGKDVMDTADQVVNELSDQRIMNFVGRTTLTQSAALIQRSQKFIGPDSGLMHIACAVGTPVVAVFGPGNLRKWQPKGQQHRVITENVSCSPCTLFGYTVPTCQGTYHCMKDIKIKEICKL